jgi:hypothetical protein
MRTAHCAKFPRGFNSHEPHERGDIGSICSPRIFVRQICKVSNWEKEWKALNFPKIARFGIATGPVHSLFSPLGLVLLDAGEVVDYAGYCINLAVRLQDHCPQVGFIIHAPLQPELKSLLGITALKMKGTLDEPVFVFEDDFKRANTAVPKLMKAKFANYPE